MDRIDKLLSESVWNADRKEWTHSCETILLGKERRIAIWDSPLPLSGFGNVQIVVEPYCPKCEEEPPSTGILRTVPSVRGW